MDLDKKFKKSETHCPEAVVESIDATGVRHGSMLYYISEWQITIIEGSCSYLQMEHVS
jgi:hypothetical protein